MKKVATYGLLAVVSAVVPCSAETYPGAAAEPPAQRQPSEQSAASRQQVSGNVSAIDQAKGLVTLATATGALTVLFPPQTLRGMHTGDPLMVEYAIAKGAAATRSYDAPEGAGEHRVFAMVDDVSHDTGWVRARADQKMLQLAFPPAVVRNLAAGDRVTIDLAFTKMPHRE
jgi:hypothetical protein